MIITQMCCTEHLPSTLRCRKLFNFRSVSAVFFVHSTGRNVSKQKKQSRIRLVETLYNVVIQILSTQPELISDHHPLAKYKNISESSKYT